MRKMTALAAALLLAAVPVKVHAEEEEEELEAYVNTEVSAYEYDVDAEGNVSLYDFLLSDTFEGELVIPSEIDGHQVSYIGNACFAEAKGVTSVTIPASLTDMGSNVFFGCTSLDHFNVEEGNTYYSVIDGVLLADSDQFLVAYPAGRTEESYTVPDGVDEIAPGAFGFAQNLHEIIIPEGVNFIDSWAFAYSGIQRAEIAGSVSQIDDYAFAYCSELSDVTLNKGIEKIGNASFAYTSGLKQITLPDSLTRIGQYAFCGSGLTCVTIPNSLESISYCAFGYDADMKPIKTFIIYGEPYTMAQDYASSSDDENNYDNSFNFLAVVDASIPYELGGGTLLQDATGDEEPLTEIGENGEVIVIETEAVSDGDPASLEDEIGAGLSGSSRLQLMLAIGGGAAIILAVVLIIAFLRSPKKEDKSGEKEEAPDDAEREADSEESAAEESTENEDTEA